MSTPFVSVVIPVWRDMAEAAVAAASASGDEMEIIGAAAWEDADTVTDHGEAGERVRWLFARRGRGNQMNVGAAAASGEWLLFLHADSILPDGWLREIRTASEQGCAAGCFRFGLDARGWRPRLWEWLVALRVRYSDLPYGDQGLFVRRDLFEAVGGFLDIPLMEDVEVVRRAYTWGPNGAAMYHLAQFPEFVVHVTVVRGRGLQMAARGCAIRLRPGAIRRGRVVGDRGLGERGVPRDLEAAVAWYRLAAEAGDADAQFNLASMLSEGEGCEQDLHAASEWLQRAVAGGYEHAEGFSHTWIH